MAKANHKQGTAGWWLLQRGWREVKQRKPPNGVRPPPLWKWGEDEPITLSEAIEIERERINDDFERKAECLLDQQIL